MHQVDDLSRHIIEVEDGRVRVEAGGVELVTVLHGQLSKRSEVLFLHRFDHLYHSAGDNRLSPMLHTEKEWKYTTICEYQSTGFKCSVLTVMLVYLFMGVGG